MPPCEGKLASYHTNLSSLHTFKSVTTPHVGSSHKGKTFTLDGEGYMVRPPRGGSRGRLLIKVDLAAETEVER
jgi:hypothetical protein